MYNQDVAKAAASVFIRHKENLDFPKGALEFCLRQDLQLDTTKTFISTVMQRGIPCLVQKSKDTKERDYR